MPPLEIDLFGAGIFAIGTSVLVFATAVTRFHQIHCGRICGAGFAKLISVWTTRAWGALATALGGAMFAGGIALALNARWHSGLRLGWASVRIGIAPVGFALATIEPHRREVTRNARLRHIN